MARYRNNNSDGGLVFGIIILGIGVLLLLKKMGVFYPSWILTWPMVLITIGVVTLVKSEFKSFFGAIMLGAGTYFLLTKEFGIQLGIDRYLFPIILIVLGIYLITKKKRENEVIRNVQNQIREKQHAKTEATSASSLGTQTETSDESKEGFRSFAAGSGTSGVTFNDTINVDAILSGVDKRVMTKNMKSAKLTAFMGGIDLDFTQADISGVVTMQVDVIFGGVKMVVPPHWNVRVEVTNIAAGVEDMRIHRPVEIDSNKVLVIRGTVLFGGLEIKSY